MNAMCPTTCTREDRPSDDDCNNWATNFSDCLYYPDYMNVQCPGACDPEDEPSEPEEEVIDGEPEEEVGDGEPEEEVDDEEPEEEVGDEEPEEEVGDGEPEEEVGDGEQRFNELIVFYSEECPGGITENWDCYKVMLTEMPFCQADDAECWQSLEAQYYHCMMQDGEAWENYCEFSDEVMEGYTRDSDSEYF